MVWGSFSASSCSASVNVSSNYHYFTIRICYRRGIVWSDSLYQSFGCRSLERDAQFVNWGCNSNGDWSGSRTDASSFRCLIWWDRLHNKSTLLLPRIRGSSRWDRLLVWEKLWGKRSHHLDIVTWSCLLVWFFSSLGCWVRQQSIHNWKDGGLWTSDLFWQYQDSSLRSVAPWLKLLPSFWANWGWI